MPPSILLPDHYLRGGTGDLWAGESLYEILHEDELAGGDDAVLPFVPLDVFKCVAAVLIARPVYKRLRVITYESPQNP